MRLLLKDHRRITVSVRVTRWLKCYDQNVWQGSINRCVLISFLKTAGRVCQSFLLTHVESLCLRNGRCEDYCLHTCNIMASGQKTSCQKNIYSLAADLERKGKGRPLCHDEITDGESILWRARRRYSSISQNFIHGRNVAYL